MNENPEDYSAPVEHTHSAPTVEKETAKAPEAPPIEIEYVDDTPIADRRDEPDRPLEEIEAGEDGGDEQYGEKVQKRIKQLRYVTNAERRAKEAAEKERSDAIAFARQLQDENQKLRSHLTTGEGLLVDQAKQAAEANLNYARQLYLAAQESGDTGAMVKANEEFARAVAHHQRISQ